MIVARLDQVRMGLFRRSESQFGCDGALPSGSPNSHPPVGADDTSRAKGRFQEEGNLHRNTRLPALIASDNRASPAG